MGPVLEKKMKKAWKVAPLCSFWSIWRERKRRAFDNCESMDQTIKNSFLYVFWDWGRLHTRDSSLPLLDFVNWLGSLLGTIAGFCVFTSFF